MKTKELINLVSKESIQAWLKSKNLKFYAKSKDLLSKLVQEHIKAGAFTNEELYDIVAKIEEYSNQTTHLFKAKSSFKSVSGDCSIITQD